MKRLRLVWFSEIRWDYLVTRKQQILTRLAHRWDILFIEPYVVGKPVHLLPVRRGELLVVTIPFLKTIPAGPLRRLQEFRLVRFVAHLIGRLWLSFILRIAGFHESKRIIGLSNLYWGPLAAKLPARLKFYDCNDDHLAFPATPRWLASYLAEFLTSADLVFAVSEELADEIQKRGPLKPILLSNGVNYRLFSTPRTPPGELARWNRPLIGYAGAMDWLDEHLLHKVARSFTEATLVLIGPFINAARRADFRELFNYSNVRYLGPKPHGELPAWVQSFDVALIPFRRDGLTAGFNPNKLYEYLATGTPIVSLDYSKAILRLKELIYVASSPAEFLEMIERALNDKQRERRREFARQYDWDVVAARLETKVEEVLAEKG